VQGPLMCMAVADGVQAAPTDLPSRFLSDLSANIDPNEKILYRDSNINELITILGKKRENCPVLVGDAGVGKTAIAEEFARRIKAGNLVVKDPIGRTRFDKSTRVISLDVSGLQSLTRQELDEEINLVLDFVTAEESAGRKIILFIDEIHRLPGDLSRLDQALKEPTGKGILQILGATTDTEYVRTFEKDKALMRRFPGVFVPALSKGETIRLLESVYTYYEKEHGVVLQSRKLIKEVVDLAYRYLADRVLPGSAITLLDHALSAVSKRQEKMANNLVGKKKILQSLLESYLTRETSPELEEDINKLVGQVITLNDALSEEVAQTRKIVTKEDILRAASEISRRDLDGIRNASNRSNLRKLAARMKRRVIGQDKAIDEICDKIIRSKVGVSEAKKPVCSVLMLGQTGVGKTEIARQLSVETLGDENGIIRFDMGEFQEPHTVSRLLGSPHGYVGSSEGGELIKAVRRNPEGIILLDEIEKAHSDIWMAFFGILEDGTASSRTGTKASFSGTKILMTSNATHAVLKTIPAIAPFLNRLDAIVTCNQLTEEDMKKIVPLRLRELKQRLQKQGNIFEWSEAAIDKLAELGFDEEYGARPLKRKIDQMVGSQITDQLLDIEPEDIKSNEAIKFSLDLVDDELLVTSKVVELPVPLQPKLSAQTSVVFERLNGRGEQSSSSISLGEIDELLGIDSLPVDFSVDVHNEDKENSNFVLAHMNPEVAPPQVKKIKANLKKYLERFGIKPEAIETCLEWLDIYTEKAVAANLDSYLKREFGHPLNSLLRDPNLANGGRDKLATILKDAQGKEVKVSFGQENDEGIVIFISNESRMSAKERLAMETMLDECPEGEDDAMEFYHDKMAAGVELDLGLLTVLSELKQAGLRMLFERVEGRTGFLLKIPAPRIRVNEGHAEIYDNNYEKGVGLKQVEDAISEAIPAFIHHPERREMIFDWLRNFIQKGKEINVQNHFPHLSEGEPIAWDEIRHRKVGIVWTVEDGVLNIKIQCEGALPKVFAYLEQKPKDLEALVALYEADEEGVSLTDMMLLHHTLVENRFLTAIETSDSHTTFSLSGRVSRKPGDPEKLEQLLGNFWGFDVPVEERPELYRILCARDNPDGAKGLRVTFIMQMMQSLQRGIPRHEKENLLKSLLEIDIPDAVGADLKRILLGLSSHKELCKEVIKKMEENNV